MSSNTNNTVNDVLTNAVGCALNALVPQLVDYLNENCKGKITDDDIYNFLGTKSLAKTTGGGGTSQKKIDTENGCQYVFTDKSKNRPNEICGSTRYKGSFFCSGCRKKKSCETQAEALAEELGMTYEEVFGPALETTARGSSSSSAGGRGRGSTAAPSRGPAGGRGAAAGGRGEARGAPSRGREGPPRRDVPPRGIVEDAPPSRGRLEGGRTAPPPSRPSGAPASKREQPVEEHKEEYSGSQHEEDEDDMSMVKLKDMKGFMLEEKSGLIIINEEEDGDPDHMIVVGVLQDGKIRALKDSDVAKAKSSIDSDIRIDRKYYENSKQLRAFPGKVSDDVPEEDPVSADDNEQPREEDPETADVDQQASRFRGRGRSVV
jgi:hypothetical protein